MLTELIVRNIALIDQVHICFQAGLHALTGETGAGKSIVIDAITLLLGGRASRELIRQGTERAYVEGVFTLQDAPAASAVLQEWEMEADEPSVTLSREVSLAGRSVCRVNGVMVALNDFKRLSALLMDIHGQHEHQSLMDERQHLRWLDAFGPAEHLALMGEVRQLYERWHDTQTRLERLKKKLQEQSERADILEYQRSELEAAHLVAGEEDALTQERDLYRNAEKIETHLRGAYQHLYDGGSAASAVDDLRQALSHLEKLSGLDGSLDQALERLNNLYYEAEDLGILLRDRLDSLNFDEDRMEEISRRLDQLRRLGRKYGATSEDMLKKLEEIHENLRLLENAQDDTDRLEREVRKAHEAYAAAAERLSEARRALGKDFEKKMEAQLQDLNMKGTRFRVNLTHSEETAAGRDHCAFLIAPNLGEQYQPLAQTASGGELSRIMLAIKALAGAKSLIPSMVFDEIDTGISGRTAQVVAEKMADIAHYRQVLCVTHLPQIAAMADHQYLIEKSFNGERTITTVSELDQAGRVDELSRMLGGVEGQTQSAVEHASALLRQAEQYKQNRAE